MKFLNMDHHMSLTTQPKSFKVFYYNHKRNKNASNHNEKPKKAYLYHLKEQRHRSTPKKQEN